MAQTYAQTDRSMESSRIQKQTIIFMVLILTEMKGSPTRINLLEESTGIHLCDLELSNDFLGMTPKAQMLKEKTGK